MATAWMSATAKWYMPRIEYGWSLRSRSEMLVSSNRWSRVSWKTPVAVSARITRYSDGAWDPVASAISSAERGPSASWSGTSSSTMTRTAIGVT
jgi:hypothetical protein